MTATHSEELKKGKTDSNKRDHGPLRIQGTYVFITDPEQSVVVSRVSHKPGPKQNH